MNIKFFSAIAVTAALFSCSGNKTASDSTNTGSQEPTADIKGKWLLENIVVNDSVNVRPAEEIEDPRQYIEFDDSTYFISTNCNSISGWYKINGDSIILGDGAMTEMACENMATEDMLRQVLPYISTIDVINDSITRLNSAEVPQYIVLHKIAE